MKLLGQIGQNITNLKAIKKEYKSSLLDRFFRQKLIILLGIYEV